MKYATAITEAIIIKSIIISNDLAVEKSFIIPETHIMIKTIGNKYFITKVHVLPTVNVEDSFKTSKKRSTPYTHANIIH